MHLPLTPPIIADIADFSLGQLAGILIPVAGIILAGVIAVAGMYFHNRRREMWHETARIALEKGQPLPPLGHRDDEDEKKPGGLDATHDVRGGMVLIAVGAGLWLMLGSIADRLRYIGAIPGFIGVALLLFALLSAVFRRKDQSPPQDPTTRS
jgi:hypothetical protein